MYFKEAEQLASIFHSLEESNLFLITNLKEIEQEIEEAKSKYEFKQEVLNSKKKDLLDSKIDLQKQLVVLDEEIEELKKTTNKDEISDLYSALESEIIRISKDTLSVPRKNISAL